MLFFFLDGVGLGPDDPATNPFAAASTPAIAELLDGRRLVNRSAPFHGDRASLLALDACLGMPGKPQSATGQAALLTGHNVPKIIGGHDGPKPSPLVAAELKRDNLFMRLCEAGRTSALLNAYPDIYFENLRSGLRLPGAIAMAALAAGLSLSTTADLVAGNALSADFTGNGWHERLGHTEVPILTPRSAGERLALLSRRFDLAFFEYWPSDVAGHRLERARAMALVEMLDQVLDGLTAAWHDEDGLIVITSDHGNLEDLTSRSHTTNPVPLLLIGDAGRRRRFADSLIDLTGVTPAILRVLLG